MGGMKSFRARPEPRKIGSVAIIAFILISLFILSLIKARCTTSHSVKLQSSLQLKASTSHDVKTVPDEIIEDEDPEETTLANMIVNASKPVCFETSPRSDTCDAEGDVRIQGISNTIYIPSTMQHEWKVKPYARKGDVVALSHVKEWSLKSLSSNNQQPPACTKNHTVPALLFSLGGFTGNLFHDFTDVLVPVFATAHQFHGEVQFLISDVKSWWVNKFISILRQLSHYNIVNLDTDGEDIIRCFPRVIAGLIFHKELGIDASKTPTGYSILDFKKLLRNSLGLQRTAAMTEGIEGEPRTRPRLLIISRKHSRAFTNEQGMVAMATSLGFEVRIAEPGVSSDVSKFARLVNSADVMIGVHGAGLTNMVYLPEGAVVIQVIPFGGLEWLGRNSFEEPSKDMKLHYLGYVIQEDESSLIEQYPRDHAVFKDPLSIRKQGWNALKEVYLDKQNVRPHLGRLKYTLMEALKLLSQHTT